MSKQTYSEKLKDPRWQRKRLEVMQRDSFTCRGCHSTEKTLNVHHVTYLPKTEPWDYNDAMLITYCEECHEKAHENFAMIAMAFSSLDMGEQSVFLTHWIERAEELSSSKMLMLLLSIALSTKESFKTGITAAAENLRLSHPDLPELRPYDP